MKELSSTETKVLKRLGLPVSLDFTRYAIPSPKITKPVSILVLSDLHDEEYGTHMERLLSAVHDAHPDLILMPGDMAQRGEQEHTMEFMHRLRDYPCYYSTGNHEEFRWDLSELLDEIEDTGVHVLDRKEECIIVNDTKLELVGMPSMISEEEYTAEDINALFREDCFRILLCHKPHHADMYRKCQCDLIVSGHAHGGQWRLPGTDLSAIAPQQGLFPKYTSGMHDMGQAKLVISRGLTTHYHGIPRLFNNPELVMVELMPEVK